MRRICLAAALLVAVTASAYAQDKKAPCASRVFHAYSECQKDGFWHVVTDAICSDGTRDRVGDIATDQSCSGPNAKKAPQPKTHLRTDQIDCNSPVDAGSQWIQECISGLWHNVKYDRLQCLDGSIRLKQREMYSTNVPCDQDCPALNLTNPGTLASSIPLPAIDLGEPASWSGPEQPIARDGNTQLMIIDLLDFNLPGNRSASAEPLLAPGRALGVLADAWRSLAHAAAPSFARGLAVPAARDVWIDPGDAAVLQGVTRAARVHAYLTSLGTSTGEAFDITVVNDSPSPVHLTGDGVVVEPIKKGSDRNERGGLQKAMATRGASVMTSKANAYCLEFKLNPPEQGSMFHVVDAATQRKYSAARDILHASRQLQAGNQLQPDSDPQDYYHAIRQWAIWVEEQHFTTRAQYTQAFVERTKKNFANARQQWTKQAEDFFNQLAPHRWDEIVKILKAAGHPVPGA